MSYDPRVYWPDRYQRQGPSYVAPGGHEELVDPQAAAVIPYFSRLPTSGRVLDYGCGPERFRPALEAHGLQYDGVDLIPELGTMDVGDIEPESFDCAVAIFVLQHIVSLIEYQEAVYLLRRALKPGGRLLVVDREPRTDVEWFEHMSPRGEGHIPMDGEVIGTCDGHWIGVFTK